MPTLSTIREIVEANWDRNAFLVVMRRIEILLINNLQATAIDALRQFVAWSRPEPPSLASAVHDVLPLRLANVLDEHGYETLQAAGNATAEELSQIPQVGPKAIELIKAATQAARSGRRLPDLIRNRAQELEPEFSIDWEYFSTFVTNIPLPLPQMKELKMQESSSAKSQLELLLRSIENADQTVSQIDNEISKLESTLKNLKRLRKLIAPDSKDSKDIAKLGWSEAESAILDVVKSGPHRPKAISAVTGLDTGHIGRIAVRSEKLSRRVDGSIEAKT